MTLDLSAEQPAETMAEATQPQSEIIATLVTIDGVVVRVADRPDGSLALLPAGNRAPIVLDRWQRGALFGALEEAAS